MIEETLQNFVMKDTFEKQINDKASKYQFGDC
jgi:hypothetical protein